MYFALQGYAFYLHRFTSFMLTSAAMGIAAIACILTAAWHVQAYFVTPSIKEMEFIHSELERANLSNHEAIHVIRHELWRPFYGQIQYLGASSARHFTPAAMLGFALRDVAPEYAHLPITSSAFDDPTPPPQGSFVLDMSKGFIASSQ